MISDVGVIVIFIIFIKPMFNLFFSDNARQVCAFYVVFFFLLNFNYPSLFV